MPGSKLVAVDSLGNGLQVIIGSNYQGTQRVVVVAQGEAGTVTQPRTAAQDICS